MACWIGAAVVMVAMIGSAFCAEEKPEVLTYDETNAASDYVRAAKAYRPVSAKVSDANSEAVAKKHLADNQAALAHVRKGLTKRVCEFLPKAEYAPEKAVPNLKTIRELGQLLLLEAMVHSESDRNQAAAKTYLDAISFANHIGQGMHLECKLLESQIKIPTLMAITDFAAATTDRKALSRLTSGMRSTIIKGNRPYAFFRIETERLTKAMVDNFKQGVAKQPSITKVEGLPKDVIETLRKKGLLDGSMMIKLVECQIDKSMRPFLTAAKDVDWAAFQKAEQALAADRPDNEHQQADVLAMKSIVLEMGVAYKEKKYDQVVDRTEAYNRFIGQKMSQAIVGTILPTQLHLTKKLWWLAEVEDAALIYAGLCSYRLTRKQFPKTLEELAPDYLKQVPVDRFTGKAMDYTVTPGGITLRGYGANGVNDEEKPRKGSGDDVVLKYPRKNK